MINYMITMHRLWCPRISSNSFCTETNNYRH